MTSMNETAPIAGHRARGLALTGLVAVLTATAVTTLAAGLAAAAGVDFSVPDGGETIPLPGFAVVTGLFSVVGVVLAAAFALIWLFIASLFFVRRGYLAVADHRRALA